MEIETNNPDAVYVGPSSSVEQMHEFGLSEKSVKQVAHGQKWQTGDVVIHAVDGRDWADDSALCYVIESANAAIFLGGDILYFDGFERYGKQFDITAAALALAGLYPVTGSPESSPYL